MKQILFIALLLLCTSMAFGQDFIRTYDGKEIAASIQEINEDSIVYKLWSDPEGPIYRIDKKEVVKVALRSGAEYYYSELYRKIEAGAYVPESIYFRGGNLYNAKNGLRLSNEEEKSFLPADQYDKYLSAKKLTIVKNVLLYPGLVLMITGTACSIIAICHDVGPGFAPASFASASVGTVLVLAAIPVAIVAGSKAKKVVNNFNEERGYLSFGATNNGLGIAYVF